MFRSLKVGAETRFRRLLAITPLLIGGMNAVPDSPIGIRHERTKLQSVRQSRLRRQREVGELHVHHGVSGTITCVYQQRGGLFLRVGGIGAELPEARIG